MLGETAQAVAFSSSNPVRVLVSHSIDCGRSELPGFKLLGIASTGQPWLRHSLLAFPTSLTLSGYDYPGSVRALITSFFFSLSIVSTASPVHLPRHRLVRFELRNPMVALCSCDAHARTHGVHVMQGPFQHIKATLCFSLGLSIKRRISF
jgi:hypothetical protein